MINYWAGIKTTWNGVLHELWDNNEDFKKTFHEMNILYSTSEVYPHNYQVFRCFTYSNVADTKVVIVGQDPYYRQGQANGLAFSVNQGVKIPPSLKNIFKELENDLGIKRTSTDLSDWASQGVLLMNSALTVGANQPMSHHHLHWERSTDLVIKYLSSHYQNIVYILWGNYAISKKSLIDEQHNLVLCAPHPSPLSAHHGFFNSHPFSKTNNYLKKHDKKPILW